MNKFKFGDKVLNSDGVLGVVTNEIDGACFVAWTCYELDQGWYRESELTPTTDWVKFDITDIETYPPANDSRLIRFRDGTYGTVYVTDNNADNPLGCGVDKKWSFYSDAGFANLENVTHHHPLPAPPQD